jgi:hypothetical protein
MAKDGDDERRELVEPAPVPCLFCSGVLVEPFDGLVRLIGWVDAPMGTDTQHRSIARLVLTRSSADRLQRSLAAIDGH